MENINIARKSREGEEHYESTPRDAFIFASTGCDGVSFCIVPRDGDIALENSPIYTLSPVDFEEGTVVWTAKNIHDFLKLSILFKTAWYAGLYDDIYMTEDEFIASIKERNEEIMTWDEYSRSQVEAAVNAIEGILPETDTKYDFNYFQSSYRNIENHMQLSFKDGVKMREYKLGCYGEIYRDEDAVEL